MRIDNRCLEDRHAHQCVGLGGKQRQRGVEGIRHGPENVPVPPPRAVSTVRTTRQSHRPALEQCSVYGAVGQRHGHAWVGVHVGGLRAHARDGRVVLAGIVAVDDHSGLRAGQGDGGVFDEEGRRGGRKCECEQQEQPERWGRVDAQVRATLLKVLVDECRSTDQNTGLDHGGGSY